MPRPVTKAELLRLSDENLNKLLSFIDSLPADYQDRRYDGDVLNDRDKTISDVVCHLHEWHNLMEGWYKTGMAGKKPIIPAEGVTWQNLPLLNHRIYEEYLGTGLAQALKLLRKSHKTMMSIIESHSDDELFTKRKYGWTGTTSLGAYLISATSSHYDWALKTIKPIKKPIR